MYIAKSAHNNSNDVNNSNDADYKSNDGTEQKLADNDAALILTKDKSKRNIAEKAWTWKKGEKYNNVWVIYEMQDFKYQQHFDRYGLTQEMEKVLDDLLYDQEHKEDAIRLKNATTFNEKMTILSHYKQTVHDRYIATFTKVSVILSDDEHSDWMDTDDSMDIYTEEMLNSNTLLKDCYDEWNYNGKLQSAD